MRSFNINGNYNKYVNKNIYKVISSIYPALSVGNLNKVFRLKDIKVNKSRVDKSYILKPNDFVEIYLSDEILFGTDFSLNYIYEDDNILAVYKKQKIPSCNETHNYLPNDIFLENIVRKDKGNTLHICHRLDTNTQGIVLFAKNSLAHEEIKNASKSHQIEKKYVALVYSKPPKKQDILDAFLLKDSTNSYVRIYDNYVDNSVPICTEYSVLKYLDKLNASLLEITLHTGKTHQIRAHLKHIGCPVIGDPKYCPNDINKNFKQKSQCLFAYEYSFNFKNDSTLFYLNNVKIKLNIDDLFKKLFTTS